MNHFAFTRSGRHIDLANPQAAMFSAQDIAEHLAKHPMYHGATQGFYSAAQHCTILAGELARTEGSLAALYALVSYAPKVFSDEYPAKLEQAIHEAFDLDWPRPKAVSDALECAKACVELTELKQLCKGCDAWIAYFARKGAVPLRTVIKPLAWDRACDRYIAVLRTHVCAAALPQLESLRGIL